MGTRRKSRELALQMLFQADMGKQDAEQVRKTFWAEHGTASAEVRGFADDVFVGKNIPVLVYDDSGPQTLLPELLLLLLAALGAEIEESLEEVSKGVLTALAAGTALATLAATFRGHGAPPKLRLWPHRGLGVDVDDGLRNLLGDFAEHRGHLDGSRDFKLLRLATLLLLLGRPRSPGDQGPYQDA